MANPVSRFDHFRLYRATSTHMPFLIKYVQQAGGPILEYGSGLFSTPLLHWLCHPNIQLLTVENHPGYFEFAHKLESPNHHIVKIDDFETYTPPGHFKVALIDHSPNMKGKYRQRGMDVIKLKDQVDYLILHDTEPEEENHYKYNLVWGYFKYRLDWKDEKPWTTVLSNIPLL